MKGENEMDVGEILSAYLDGELSDTEQDQVKAQLKSSHIWEKTLFCLKRTRAMLLNCAEKPNFHERLKARISRDFNSC